MTRRLVITADDLGRDPATDATVVALARDGDLTAASLLTVTPHAAAALGAVRAAGLEPALHATLTSEGSLRPWRSLSGASGLGGPRGHLESDSARAVAAATPQEVIGELDAQLGWMHARGARPAVLDNHAGTLYGLHGRSFLEPVLHWCADRGLAFRLPRDLGASVEGDPSPAVVEGHRRAVRLADRLGVPLPAACLTNRRTAAQHGSYEELRDHMIAQLRRAPEGTSELFLHPRGDGDAVPGPLPVRAWEARLLRDRLWHRALQREGLDLVAGWDR